MCILESRARPILILERLKTSNIVKQIAPNQNTIGMMLPYTPLHYLLLSNRTGQISQFPRILVMTSGT
jgi:hydrogenase maturation protein HypF